MTSFTNTTLNYPQLSNSPIRRVIAKRSPTANDKRNFTLGDEWLNEIANQWWKLVALNNITGANWVLVSAQGTGILSLTGNSGGAVMADGLMNINVIGSSPIDIAGNPGTNTLTVSSDGTLATNYIEDVGTATPSSGNLNVIGGVGIATNGAGNSITIATNDLIAKVYDGDVGSAAPALGVLNIFGGTGVDTSAAGNTVTINASANVPTTFNEDVGSATPAANILNIVGGAGISTAGAGSTVTITALAPTNLTFTENTGTATPAADNINVVGTATNGIATTGAADTVTVAMNSPYADGDFEFRSSVSGATRTLLVDNTSNTAASQATVNIKVAGFTAGDAWTQYTAGSSYSWAMGLSNSNTHALRICADTSGSVTPSTGANVWQMDSNGYRTMPFQAAFLAHQATAVPNVTGDGTVYTVIYSTVDFDVRSNYNNATGLFTAPVSGVYQFYFTISVTNVSASHTTGYAQITRNGTFAYSVQSGNPANLRNASTTFGYAGGMIISLTAGDTIGTHIVILNGTKTVSINGNQLSPPVSATTLFSGALLF